MRYRFTSAVPLLICVSMASAADSIDLKAAARAGQRFKFDSTTNIDMKVNYTAAGRSQEAEQKISQVQKGTATILEVSEGRPAAIRAEFSPDCGGKIESSNGQNQEQKATFAGQTITIRRDSSGAITNDGKNISDTDQKTLAGFINRNLSLYPKKSVTIGDSWDGDSADVAQQFGLEQGAKAHAHYTLKQVQSQDGRQIAVVAGTVTASHKEGGVDVTISAEGQFKVDLATGAGIGDDLTGTIESEGLVTQQNPTTNERLIIEVKGSGPMKVRSNFEPIPAEVGDVPAADQPEPAPAGVGDSIAGKYDGDGISVELTPAGDGYSGAIHMGEKNFPLKARKDGNSLTGSFKSGDDSYDFSATINGREMKLSSGGANYALKKKSAHPLEKPRKPNPLGGGSSELPATPATPDASSPRASEHASGKLLRFQRYSLKDDQVIRGEAASLLIPAGWQVNGGIQWRTHIYYPTFVDLQIRDPAGVDALHILPTIPCSWAKQPLPGFQEGAIYAGNLVKRPCSPTDFIRQIVLPYLRKDLQGAEIVKTEDLPDVAKSALAGQASEAGFQKTAQAAKVRFRYEERGVSIEEDVYCGLVYGENAQMIYFNPDIFFSFRADAGTLDEKAPILKVIQSSVRPNLNWYNRLIQIIQIREQAGYQQIHDIGEWSKMYARTSAEVSKTITDSYWKTQAAQEKMSHNFSQSMRGVETYNDPWGHSYDLPNTYGNAWINNRGEILMSADASYDPSAELKEEWHPMSKP